MSSIVDKYESAQMALGALYQEALIAGNMNKIEKAQRELYDFINDQRKNDRPPEPKTKPPEPTAFSDSGT